MRKNLCECLIVIRENFCYTLQRAVTKGKKLLGYAPYVPPHKERKVERIEIRRRTREKGREGFADKHVVVSDAVFTTEAEGGDELLEVAAGSAFSEASVAEEF
ncbi:hypothetical protein RJ639_036500 [Escallonia herrerae]|uniref:Uncharacterized protein n=1 Tax=Escallonia herrerae TaxID=1293975 RepID=A0AA88WTM0_9ASTE|nr:hypothetical protein RJ639_036500 [Escallonia herrerae]